MPTDLLPVVQIAVGLVFLRSALGKLRHPQWFLRGVEDYRVIPARLVPYAGAFLIVAEVVIALSHLSGWFLVVIVPASIALLALLGAIVTITIRRGLAVSCLCFGAGEEQEVVSMRTTGRLGVLLCAELLLWLGIHSGASSTMYDLGARELAIAALQATLTLTVVSWVFAVHEVSEVQRPCRTCGTNA